MSGGPLASPKRIPLSAHSPASCAVDERCKGFDSACKHPTIARTVGVDNQVVRQGMKHLVPQRALSHAATSCRGVQEHERWFLPPRWSRRSYSRSAMTGRPRPSGGMTELGDTAARNRQAGRCLAFLQRGATLQYSHSALASFTCFSG